AGAHRAQSGERPRRPGVSAGRPVRTVHAGVHGRGGAGHRAGDPDADPFSQPTGGVTTMKLQRRTQGGFTLIEIMVVVVILGILAALVVPQVMSRPEQAKVTVAKGDIKAVAAALDMYKLDNFAYPSTQQGLEALVN